MRYGEQLPLDMEVRYEHTTRYETESTGQEKRFDRAGPGALDDTEFLAHPNDGGGDALTS